MVSIKDKTISKNTMDTLLMTFLISSLYLFVMKSWGRYVLLSVAVIMFAINVIGNRGWFVLSQGYWVFFGFIAVFCLFCFFSSTWAWSAQLAISKGTSILETLLCFSLLYFVYYQKKDIRSLFISIIFAGVVVACYTLLFYGRKELLFMASEGARAQNDYANVNSIGMLMSIAMIILYCYCLQEKKAAWLLLMLPMIPVLVITQSRKAFGMLFIGIFLVTVMNGSQKKLLRLFFGIIILFALTFAVSRISLFSGIVKRFEDTVLNFINGRADIRTVYRRIGMMQFKKSPILGIGIGNSPLLLSSVGERATYLHCNYVELLACGGIIGFALYYSIYVYLFWNLIKFRRFDSKSSTLCIILLAVLFIKDYAFVSYYSKQEYIYFMCFFLQTEKLKKAYKSSLRESSCSAAPLAFHYTIAKKREQSL